MHIQNKSLKTPSSLDTTIASLQRQLSDAIKEAQEHHLISDEDVVIMYTGVLAIAYMVKATGGHHFVLSLLRTGIAEIEREVAHLIKRGGTQWARRESYGNRFLAEATRAVNKLAKKYR